ncbi:helix-turn-helix domain-containing protein [Stutzerimonas kunmingensis]|uniref:helix-turn-helix domain-containing protein n=1 Tax=Stutzerimonas kunmingensis TaxID=1211807 RepID=UPI003AB6695A
MTSLFTALQGFIRPFWKVYVNLSSAFGKALKRARHKRNLTQDDFSLVAARSFMGLIERGGTSPTLDKIDMLSERVDLHPVTLIALSYAIRDGVRLEDVLLRIKAEAEQLALDEDAPQPARRPKRKLSPR